MVSPDPWPVPKGDRTTSSAAARSCGCFKASCGTGAEPRDSLGARQLQGFKHLIISGQNLALVIDDDSVFIGSANLDPRSLRINTEMGLLVDSRELNARLRAAVEAGGAGGVRTALEALIAEPALPKDPVAVLVGEIAGRIVLWRQVVDHAV